MANKGRILEWNNGKGYLRGLLLNDEKQPPVLRKQGRAMVYKLDEDFNIMKDENGKKLVSLVTLKNCTTIGYQD